MEFADGRVQDMKIYSNYLNNLSSEDFFQSCPLPPPIIQADFNLPEPPRLNPMQRTALDLQGQGRGGHKGPRAFSEEVQQGNASCWTGHVRRNRVCVPQGKTAIPLRAFTIPRCAPGLGHKLRGRNLRKLTIEPEFHVFGDEY